MMFDAPYACSVCCNACTSTYFCIVVFFLNSKHPGCMLSVLSRDPCRSRIRLRCNGWTKGDVLKIFVRPGGGGRVSCCDLAIGLAGKARLSEGSPPYGLLWADPARVDEGLEGAGSWREEDVSRWQ